MAVTTTEWKNDGWHTDDMIYDPPPKLADWDMVYCGCTKCIVTDYYLKNSIPPNNECLKEIAYEKALWEISRRRFEKISDPYPRCKEEWLAKHNPTPATDKQFAEWMSWGTPLKPEDIQTRKESIKKGWDTYKFDPIDMEHEQWKKRFYDIIHKTPMWAAFLAFGEEQYALYHEYMNLSNSIHTKEKYENADKKYKELATHIDKHGHIMWYTLKKIHELPKQKVVEENKVGRRQARRLRHDEESKAIMADTRVKKITNAQSYVVNDD